MSNMDLPRAPIANAAMAVALANAGAADPSTFDAAVTRPASFDPAVYIDEQMLEPQLKHRLMSSLAWTLDNKVISACVVLYNQIHSEVLEKNPEAAASEQETMALVIENVRGMREVEGYWGEGTASRLMHFASLQHDWHQIADRMAIVAGFSVQPLSREYDFEQRIRNAQVGDVRQLSMENFKVIATEEASAVPESQREQVYAETLAALVSNSKARMKKFLDGRRQKLAGLRAIYVEALHMAGDDGNAWHRLDTQTKLDFTLRLRRKTTDVRMQLADQLDVISFTQVMRESRTLTGVLDKVIDKYARDLQSENRYAFDA